ncbi:hypothetical protein K438DRAFT_1781727 [Mycena galopus ATCC 62051]|nr:hypothetical protein K438DRAFT_1781727 [Mycena galopus ATCC 62051]
MCCISACASLSHSPLPLLHVLTAASQIQPASIAIFIQPFAVSERCASWMMEHHTAPSLRFPATTATYNWWCWQTIWCMLGPENILALGIFLWSQIKFWRDGGVGGLIAAEVTDDGATDFSPPYIALNARQFLDDSWVNVGVFREYLWRTAEGVVRFPGLKPKPTCSARRITKKSIERTAKHRDPGAHTVCGHQTTPSHWLPFHSVHPPSLTRRASRIDGDQCPGIKHHHINPEAQPARRSSLHIKLNWAQLTINTYKFCEPNEQTSSFKIPKVWECARGNSFVYPGVSRSNWESFSPVIVE